MANNINNNHSGNSDYKVTINIPENVKKNLPQDFNINEIGNIDLQEAESIANEDILYLTENDLIEGLEEFDLIPLKEQADKTAAPSVEHEANKTGVATEERPVKEEKISDTTEIFHDVKKSEAIDNKEKPSHETLEKKAENKRKGAGHGDDKRRVSLHEKKWVPLEEVDVDNIDGTKWISIEELMNDTGNKTSSAQAVEEAEIEDEEWRLTEEAEREAEEQRLAGEAEREAEEQRLAGEAEREAEEQRLAGEAEREAEELHLAGEAEREAEERRLAGEAEREAEERRLTGEAEREAEEQRLAGEAEKEVEEPRFAGETEKEAEQQIQAEKEIESVTEIEDAGDMLHGKDTDHLEEEIKSSDAGIDGEDEDVIWFSFDGEAGDVPGSSDQGGDVVQEKKKPETDENDNDLDIIEFLDDDEPETGEQISQETPGEDNDLEGLEPVDIFYSEEENKDKVPAEKPGLQNDGTDGENDILQKTGGMAEQAAADDENNELMKETLPVDIQSVGEKDTYVNFIDDESVIKDDIISTAIFDESNLDKITSNIVIVDEGKSFLMNEATLDDDRGKIALMTDGFTTAMDETPAEFDDEYRYRDEELDYIHSAIVEEDYSKYIRQIDEYYGFKGDKVVSTATEILGLTVDEFDTIEDILFEDDYKDVDFHDVFDFFSFSPDKSGREFSIEKNCMYLVSDPQNLKSDERKSIENDISSYNALIFEEDISDIKKQLDALGVKKKVEKVEIVDTIYDITDSVVILEDENDVERFVNDFPEDKRVDIKTLLKFMDGLFERLPENIIKKFASSEYFDLYLKVLNELGV